VDEAIEYIATFDQRLEPKSIRAFE
jgi:hypothetical protein